MQESTNNIFTCRLDRSRLDSGITAADLVKMYTFAGVPPMIVDNNGISEVTLVTDELIPVNGLISDGFRTIEKGSYDDAVNIFKKAIDKCPFLSDAYRGIGFIKQMQGNLDDAMDYFIQALKWDHGNEPALDAMGKLMIQLGNNEAAEKYFSDVLRFNPDNTDALNSFGMKRCMEGKFEEAEVLFRRSLEKDPDNLGANMGMVRIEQEKGNMLGAFEWWRTTMLKGISKYNNPNVPPPFIMAYMETAKKAINQQPTKVMFDMAHRMEKEYGCIIKLSEDEDLESGAYILYPDEDSADQTYEIKYNPEFPNYSFYLLSCICYITLQRQDNIDACESGISYDEEQEDLFVQEMSKEVSDSVHFEVGSDNIDKMIRPFHSFLITDIGQLATDLIVGNFLLREHPEFRPHHMMGLLSKLSSEVASNNGNDNGAAPKRITKAVRLISMVQAVFVLQHYGINLIDHYNHDKEDTMLAMDLYEHFEKLYESESMHMVRCEFVKFLVEKLKLDKYYTIEE